MEDWDKGKVSAIVSILLSTLLALLAVFGYDVKVIQPREAAALTAPVNLPPLAGERGVTGFNDLQIDSLTASGAVTAGGPLIQGAKAITVTNDMTLTPAASTYVLSSAGAVALTLAAPAVSGQVLYLYGDDANTITVNDSNILTTDGNGVTIGQYDLVEFISVGDKWVHVAKSANS